MMSATTGHVLARQRDCDDLAFEDLALTLVRSLRLGRVKPSHSLICSHLSARSTCTISLEPSKYASMLGVYGGLYSTLEESRSDSGHRRVFCYTTFTTPRIIADQRRGVPRLWQRLWAQQPTGALQINPHPSYTNAQVPQRNSHLV